MHRVSLSSTTERKRSVAKDLHKAAAAHLQTIRESLFQEITRIIVSVGNQICNNSSVNSERNQRCELYNSVTTCVQ